MDFELERELLQMVDDFLSRPTIDFDLFISFQDRFKEFYAERTGAVGDIPPDMTLPEFVESEYGDQVLRQLDEQLPPERRTFFNHLAERMSYTTPDEPSPREFGYGYRVLGDFVEMTRREREGYRLRFQA